MDRTVENRGRRAVLKGAAALAAAAAAGDAFAADALPPLSPMGLAQTALNNHLRSLGPGGRRIDGVALVDYCRGLGAGGVEFTPAGDLARVRARLERHGMFYGGNVRLPDTPDGDLAAFEQALRDAKACGAAYARVVSLGGRRYEEFKTPETYRAWATRADAILDRCVPIAERVGLPLALENHKDRVVDEQVALLRRFSSEHLGALVDLGNNIALLDDPQEVVTRLAPYAKACHLKNMGVVPAADGFLMSEVRLDAGMLDVAALFAILKRANPRIRPVHELITRNPLSIPCLAQGYWASFPERNGRYLAATLVRVRDRASKRPLPTVAGLSPAAMVAAEEANNRHCSAWALRHLA